MSRQKWNQAGGGLLSFDGRGGAARTVSLLEKPSKRDVTTLRALMLQENKADFAQRLREYSRMDLMKRRSTAKKAFGATLRHYRKLVGYSQEEVASICGIDRTYPSLLERGLRTPTITVVIALACALKITPVELYCTFLDTLRDRARAGTDNRPIPRDIAAPVEGVLLKSTSQRRTPARRLTHQTHS